MLDLRLSARAGALDLDVELRAAPGAPVALAGPSGAGKTTVLRTAAGLARPAAGRIACGDAVWLDTEAGVDLPPEERRCGLVFQDHALFPHLSAWRNVAYAVPKADLARFDRLYHGQIAPVGRRGAARTKVRRVRRGRSERRARAMALLGRFGVAHRAEARPRELSGGERQRVALARALAAEPRALLLDEPLASLDPRTRARSGRELAELLGALDVPAVVVTHDFIEATLLASTIAVLDSGRIAQTGTPSELASSPASAFVADYTGAIVLTGTARAGSGGLTEVDLDGGGTVTSTDAAGGPVAVSVHPWDVAIEAAGASGPAGASGSAQNRLPADVTSLTSLGNRTRVGLAAPQPLTAEITTESAERLDLKPGTPVTAVWKAAATRLLPL